nr:hypothetical protein GTC16762_23290 [Pigmentibacter ruber]
MRNIVKVFLNISAISFLSLNQANANVNNQDQFFILNSNVENISQNQSENNRQILELQNKLESLTRKLDTINSTREAPKVPAGTVVAFAGKVIPKGWLLCDGKVISRKGEYQALFDSIGTAHGQGDGSTTFHLPDYRGLFLRGVLNERSGLMDPSATTRGSMNTGGNTGNKVGSYQGDAFAEHSHNSGNLRNSSSYLSYSNGVAKPNIPSKNYETSLSFGGETLGNLTRVQLGHDNGVSYGINSDGSKQGEPYKNIDHFHYFSVDFPNYNFSINTTIPAQTISGTTSNQGGSETRPKNAYVNYIIKY